MISRQRLSLLLAPMLCLSCMSLSYPSSTPAPESTVGPNSSPGTSQPPGSSATAAASEAAPPGTQPSPATGFGVPETLDPADDEEPARSWSELTRLAREAQQRNDDQEVSERLEQAALLVADLPATNVRRSTTLGLRARHAIVLARRDKIEEADALADTIFAEVEAEPALAGPALVPLALSVAERRKAAAEEAGEPDAQLPLLAIALQAAQRDRASQDRLRLAFRISGEALREGDLGLARRAIDQAVLDAQRVAPLDLLQSGSLRIYKARVALAQGDLETAEAAATSASQIFEEAGAGASSHVIAEATLARILVEKGDVGLARIVVESAEARLASEEPVADHARREFLGSAGRVESASGDLTAARTRYRDALDIPPRDWREDEDLISKLAAELAALDESASTAEPAEAPDAAEAASAP